MHRHRPRAVARRIPSFRPVERGLTALAVLGFSVCALQALGGSPVHLAFNVATAIAAAFAG